MNTSNGRLLILVISPMSCFLVGPVKFFVVVFFIRLLSQSWILHKFL